MMPAYNARKREQDEARREQQADERPISTIYLPQSPEDEFYTVGYDGVARIEVYEENGEKAPVPWIAVYKGEEVVMRSAARHWIIEYAASGGDHSG